MWWTVAREAATNWSGHKDARQGAALFGGQCAFSGAAGSRQHRFDSLCTGVTQHLLEDVTCEVTASWLKKKPAIAMAITMIGPRENTEESGLWHFARSYLLSFALVLALGFLLLVSLLVTAALAAAGKFVAPYMPEGILHVVSMLVSFVVVTVLFAMMFKWLPDVSVAWRDVWLGAFLTALFFEVGKAAIGFYIGKQGLESTYGAAASIVVVLIWVYYTSQIILMGAEVTHSYAKHNGSLKRRDP